MLSNLPVTIDMRAPKHSGLIIMRSHPGRQRGVMLLNASETESRIKFLPGFHSASFFQDAAATLVAEYVCWDSREALDAAFGTPDFQEHLPIVATMSHHPTLLFSKPWTVITADGANVCPITDESCAIAVLKAKGVTLDAALEALAAKAKAIVKGPRDAVIVHADANANMIGLLCVGVVDIARVTEGLGSIEIVDTAEQLSLFHSVPKPQSNAGAMRYTLAPC